MATPEIPASVGRVRALARLLDTAVKVPGTNIRFGADSLIGLVPGVGDVASAVLSGYIVLVASRLGVPAPVVARMIMNIGLDTVVGAVPVLGDLFDVAWKSNRRNMSLLEEHLGATPVRRGSGWLVPALVVAAIAVLVLTGVGVVALIRALFR